ncbi:MAG: hypothetical protein HY287_08795 [Planctomycetes bacterium]|nr:hypothetical protein [Planctomycetota bacterium]MBI3834410.1 hypothetical protein [Planctomycetota bacterium]
MNERNSGRIRTPDNHFAHEAPIAYILAVVTLEAYVNEFKSTCRRSLPGTRDRRAKKKNSTSSKLVEEYRNVTEHFGFNTFDADARLFEDFQVLVDLRDELVHYHMADYHGSRLEKHTERLKAVGALLWEDPTNDKSWLDNISTFRGTLWAANTMSAIIESFSKTFAEAQGKSLPFVTLEYRSQKEIEKEYQVLCVTVLERAGEPPAST